MPTPDEYADGYVFTTRRARKRHECEVGDGPIMPGDFCYVATIGGAGLGSLKFPDYLHLTCKQKYLDIKRQPKKIEI
ncbi:MAG: hypothetical protein PHU23_00250 [Dehalococcoidales bacterium]|nr:hypothetical protein [Dehalococcoidales bacterium]